MKQFKTCKTEHSNSTHLEKCQCWKTELMEKISSPLPGSSIFPLSFFHSVPDDSTTDTFSFAVSDGIPWTPSITWSQQNDGGQKLELKVLLK